AVPPSFAFPEPRFPLITVVLGGQYRELTLKYATINFFLMSKMHGKHLSIKPANSQPVPYP
ncbi:MAG TPA: hypothetical protein VGS79_01600, partial [Puia sp.]|nr:hypothetical protein [Puia sp.]